jgi:hypothetical protein
MFLFEREFDEFLCASIVEEKNGMVLSVMSAFARRNVDPWQEAARLSQLPRDIATRELYAMIAEFPHGLPSRASPQAIAERLMAPCPVTPVQQLRRARRRPDVWRCRGEKPSEVRWFSCSSWS